MALLTSPSVLSKSYAFSPLPARSGSMMMCPSQNIRIIDAAFSADKLAARRRPAGLIKACDNEGGGAVEYLAVAEKQAPIGEEGTSSGRRIPFSDVVVTRPTSVYAAGREWSSLDIGTATAVGGIHALAMFAPWTFSWDAFWVAAGLYAATGLLGITLSYHRNLSHRSFKLAKPLEYLFAYCGLQSLQGSPIDWVSTHRIHHKFCETERDPHSPTMGFWFSHFGWLFDSKELRDKGVLRDNVADLEGDWYYRFLEKTYALHPLALAAALYALGGWPYVVWGMGVRTCAVYHATWFVNSGGHVWGERVWRTGDLSRNNWFNAIITFGDGWHNNHHAFEFSARHGFEWWQFDPTWYFIKLLEALRLASDVKLPTEGQKAAKAIKGAAPA